MVLYAASTAGLTEPLLQRVAHPLAHCSNASFTISPAPSHRIKLECIIMINLVLSMIPTNIVIMI